MRLSFSFDVYSSESACNEKQDLGTIKAIGGNFWNQVHLEGNFRI
jgi:hypothetical protein